MSNQTGTDENQSEVTPTTPAFSPTSMPSTRGFVLSDFVIIFFLQFFFQLLFFSAYTFVAGKGQPSAKKSVLKANAAGGTKVSPGKQSHKKSAPGMSVRLVKKDTGGKKAAGSKTKKSPKNTKSAKNSKKVSSKSTSKTEGVPKGSPAKKSAKKDGTSPKKAAKATSLPVGAPSHSKKGKVSKASLAATRTSKKSSKTKHAKAKPTKPFQKRRQMPTWLMLVIALFSGIVTVGCYMFCGRIFRRMSWKEMGWLLPSGKVTIKWIVIFYPTMFGFMLAYNLVLTKVFQMPAPKQHIAGLLGSGQPMIIRLLTLFLVLVSAPLVEEMLYRGVLFFSLRRVASLRVAAVVSGLVFGLIHFEFGAALKGGLTLASFLTAFSVVVPLSLLGYLLALAYEESRSLLLPMLLHAGNNLLAFLFVLVSQV